MLPDPGSRCDCCGVLLSADDALDKSCHRCGYPVEPLVEQQFLQDSLRDLRRVATFGGANITVSQLLTRYQRRLNDLLASKAPTPQTDKEFSSVLPAQAVVSSSVSNSQLSSQPIFSPGSFFADQSINVFASLGAFLILVGSLSFVITTSERLLSFLVLLAVHLLFGSIGVFSYRSRSFRTVAAIYTAIFALLLPLVGFTAIQLFAGSRIHLSTSTSTAIVATYAAIVYSALAIYQRFSPFGYLSAVALIVADLALNQAYHLAYWWWPVTLMLLAFPALVVLADPYCSARLLSHNAIVLRSPLKFFLLVCNLAAAIGVVLIYDQSSFHSFSAALTDPFYQLSAAALSSSQLYSSLVILTLLIFVWFCLYAWFRPHSGWVHALPYLLLSNILSWLHASSANQSAYVMALIGVALIAHLLNRLLVHYMHRLTALYNHLDLFALFLIGVLPFLVYPALPLQILYHTDSVLPERRYLFQGLFLFQRSQDLARGTVALCVGVFLSVLIILYHTGYQKVPAREQTFWCRFLFLSGFVAGWTYALFLLWNNFSSVWGIFAFTLSLTLLTMLVRHYASSFWSHPLDLLALCFALLTLLLTSSLTVNQDMFVLFTFVAVSYSLLLFQRRPRWLFVPLVFALLALIPLLNRPYTLFFASLLLPCVAALVYRFVSRPPSVLPVDSAARTLRSRFVVVTLWDWPLLVCAVVYGLCFSLFASSQAISTLYTWIYSAPVLSFPMKLALLAALPFSLEIAFLAIVWYCAAVLGHARRWQLVVIVFALIALLAPTNSFWQLFVVTTLVTALAFVVRSLLDRSWSWAFYVTAISASLLTIAKGLPSTISGQPDTLSLPFIGILSLVLFFFALLAYVVLLVERNAFLLFLVAAFTGLGICLLPASMLHLGFLALFALALLTFVYGRLQNDASIRHWSTYAAGFILSLIATWELHVFQQTQLSLLTLVPASYFIVIAPFIAHDDTLPQRDFLSQLCSIIGSIVLLLPTLWSSFGPTELTMTLLLAVEALILCIVGLGMHMRFLILSGAALVIVSAIHLLFLPSFGISPFIAFMLTGLLLLAVATSLILLRPRLAVLLHTPES